METIAKSVAANWGIDSAQKLLPKEQQFSLDDTPDLSEKVAIVTGGSQGIGLGCVRTLLLHNVEKIYILSMSQERVESALKAISDDMGEEYAQKVVWLQCDLSDWKATKEVAEQIVQSTDRIDIVINNSGRGVMSHQLTEFGVDRHMALNHFGHVILTSHLLPIIKRTASNGHTVRIAMVSSNGHLGAPSSTKFVSLAEINEDVGPIGLYGRSKLANILYARYLDRHLTSQNPNILVNATYPGFVATKMTSEDIHDAFPLAGYLLSKVIKPLMKDYLQGAVSTMYLATLTTRSGEYTCPPAVVEEGSPQSRDEVLGEALMSLTADVIKQKTGESADPFY